MRWGGALCGAWHMMVSGCVGEHLWRIVMWDTFRVPYDGASVHVSGAVLCRVRRVLVGV